MLKKELLNCLFKVCRFSYIVQIKINKDFLKNVSLKSILNIIIMLRYSLLFCSYIQSINYLLSNPLETFDL